MAEKCANSHDSAANPKSGVSASLTVALRYGNGASANAFCRTTARRSGERFSSRGGRKRLRSSIYVMRGRGLRENIWLLAVAGIATAAVAVGCCATASADTLEWALVQAYQNNPSLNAQRAALRAVDENVPQALSGYRPRFSVTAAGGYNYFDRSTKRSTNKCFQTA